jgi:hypothetical protein
MNGSQQLVQSRCYLLAGVLSTAPVKLVAQNTAAEQPT